MSGVEKKASLSIIHQRIRFILKNLFGFKMIPLLIYEKINFFSQILSSHLGDIWSVNERPQSCKNKLDLDMAIEMNCTYLLLLFF